MFEAGSWGSRVLKKERRREKNIGKYRNFSFLIQGERIMPPLPNPKSGNPVPKPSFRRPPSSPPSSSCKKIFEFFPAGLEVVAMPKRDASYERLNIKTACVLHFPSSQLFLFFFSSYLIKLARKLIPFENRTDLESFENLFSNRTPLEEKITRKEFGEYRSRRYNYKIGRRRYECLRAK